MNQNLAAFLRVIRAGESSQDDSAYTVMFGGSHFESFADHPRQAIKSPWGWTSAAGAYQAMAAVPGKVKTDTWGDFIRSQGPHDFSPKSQDAFAVWCIKRRGAYEDVLAGRIEEAIRKCAKEWASLPGSPYGQPTRTLGQALATYQQYGGTFYPVDDAPAAKPQPTHAPTEFELNHPPEQPMAPFIAAALPALIEHAPNLIRIFGSGSQVSERNAKAAEKVAEIAKAVTGQATAEGAVQALQTNPAAAAEYREKVHQSMGELLAVLTEAHEADEKSRVAAMDRALELGKATGGRWLWLLGAMAAVVVSVSYAITAGVLFSEKTTFSDETKALLLGQIVIFGFVTVLGYLFGSSLVQQMSQKQRDQQ